MSQPMHPALPWRLSPVSTRLALRSPARLYTFTLMALTCVGLVLRLGLLTAYPLREDEAIYGYWARAAVTDPFFLHVWPDKPPLFIWSLTAAFALLGPSEAAARLVSVFAGTLTIPLVAVGARRLWRSPAAAMIAALLLTFNPYAVSFAPTAYTDSMLVLLATGAVVLAMSRRELGAGLLLGAACMTKQQGLFYLPLVIGFLWSTQQSWSLRKATLMRVLQGVALITLPILLWDSLRWAKAPSPWWVAQHTYAPLTWLSPQQWPTRWVAWDELLWYLGGNWTVCTLLVLACAAAAMMAWRRPHLAVLMVWGFAFVLLHLITSLQVWDRYLLPLAPWLAMVASGPLARVLQARLPEWGRRVLLLLLTVGLAGLARPAIEAARGQMPIGGDHGDYVGLKEALAWVESQEGPSILYHQVLGWHFRFYLFDELQPVGDDPPRFDLRWFPSAAYLADNATKAAYPPKFLIVPDWATPRDLALHLALRGLTLEPRLHVGRFAVLEIMQPPRPACNWCMTHAPAPPKAVLPFMLHEATSPTTPQMSTP